MEVINRPVESLIPYTLNNRTHPAEQVARIANSIAEFGFNQPIVIDEKNVVLVGHGRLMAAQKLGLKDVPTLKVENLSEAKKRAYRILDNKLQNDSEWELDNLKLELQMLEDDGFALEPWGLDSLLPEDETAEVVEDEFEPEEVDEPYIKEGDLIELGNHRVLCGDSTLAENLTELLKGDSVDFVYTDPPYGISIVKGASVGGSKPFGSVAERRGTDGASNVIKANVYAEVIGDDSIDTAVKAYRVAAQLEPRVLVFWGGNYYASALPNSSCWVVWDKDNTGNFADAELAWTNQTSAVRIFKHQWNGMIKASERGERRVHPTQKPVALAAWCFNEYGKKEDVILDMFLGSGSTLMACEQLGRRCLGLELSPKYCQVILERYKAYCEKEGKPFVCRINGEAFDGDVRA